MSTVLNDVAPSEEAVQKAIVAILRQRDTGLLSTSRMVREALDERGDTDAAKALEIEELEALLEDFLAPPRMAIVRGMIETVGAQEFCRMVFDADEEHAAHAEAIRRISVGEV